MLTYLIINGLTILIPLCFSFEGKIAYFKKWKYLFPAMTITALVFLIWDEIFTATGVWGFNPAYLVGMNVFHLPLEEILFFFCIPYSYLFVYELVALNSRKHKFGKMDRLVVGVFMGVLIAFALLNFEKWYTFTTCAGLVLLLLIHLIWIKPEYLATFHKSFVITLLPFLMVNGLLTRGLRFIDLGPVVWYNNAENLGLRIMTIPIEDFIYCYFLLLMNVTVYEYFKSRENNLRGTRASGYQGTP